jgi:hypothetical protein
MTLEPMMQRDVGTRANAVFHEGGMPAVPAHGRLPSGALTSGALTSVALTARFDLLDAEAAATAIQAAFEKSL